MVKLENFDIKGNLDKRFNNLRKKGFTTGEYLNDKFYLVYKMYSDYLMSYIDENIHLRDLDNDLVENSLLNPAPDEEQDIYQKFSDYNYFYLRSNLAIEKLSDDYIDEILIRAKNGENTYDDFAKELINNTLSDVLRDNNFDGFISYGPLNGKYFAPSGSIVVGCALDRDVGTSVFESLDRRSKLEKCINSINSEANDKFSMPFNIFIYYSNSNPIKDFTFASRETKTK